MIRSDLEARAGDLGVRADALEKVLRLLTVLDRMEADEQVGRHYALKGGTALNLFWLELPRLSVDIDVNYLGDCTAAELATLRPDFEQALVHSLQLAECRVLRQPAGHAGGKYRLRFPSALGGEQNLEVDVNYVLRVPILGTVRRGVSVPGLAGPEVTTYSLEELAAGKFAALVSRSVSRDRFDAARLLELRPGLMTDGGFRTAFVVLAAGSREDVRQRPKKLEALDPHDVRHQLLPLLRLPTASALPGPEGFAQELDATLAPAVRTLLDFTDPELAFLDALHEHGELRADLLASDAEQQSRIERQPMLRWKQQNIRAHLGRSSEGAG